MQHITNKPKKELNNMLEDYPDVLNTKEVMEILDITKNLMYELIHTDQIHAFRLGSKNWRISKEKLIEYLRKQ